MQHDGEAIQMANVQRAKVVVEGVVEERVLDVEVDGRVLARADKHRLLNRLPRCA